MANAIVEVAGLPTGLTLTLTLYPRGSDTAGASGKTLTENTNNKTVYRATVTEGLTGWHRAVVLSGTDVMGIFDVLMSDEANDHYAIDHDHEFDVTAHASGTGKADVTKLLGTAWLTPGTAGTPDVNVKLWNALPTVALPLVPTVAGRTLDVSAAGNAGIDWANIDAPTTVTDLSGTTIAVTQVIASVSGAVGSVTGAVGSVTGAVGSVTGNVGGNVTGSVGSVVGAVGSVTGAVGSVTGNVGGNVVGSLGTFTAAALAQMFTLDTTKLYADAVAGSVVKETALGAASGGVTIPQIIGGVTVSGSTYYVTYALVLNGAIQTAGLSALTVTFYDEDGTDLTFSGTPTAGATGLIYASGTLTTAVTNNRPVLVKVTVTKATVAYSMILPCVSIA